MSAPALTKTIIVLYNTNETHIMKISMVKRISLLVMSVWTIVAVSAFGVFATKAWAQSEGRTVLNHDLTIESSETVGDANVTDGDLIVNGTIDGKATVVNGDASIYGTITGDLTILTGGSITLYDGSVVEGNVFAVGNIDLQDGSRVDGTVTALGGRVNQEDGSTVGHSVNNVGNPFDILDNISKLNGTETANSISQQIGPFARFFGWLGLGIFSAVALILALGISALVPRRIRVSSATLESEPAPSVVVGIIAALLSLPIFGVASLLLASTIVGIVLVPVLALAVFGVFLFGFVIVSQWLGKRLHEGAQHPEASAEYPMRQSQSATLVIDVLLGSSVILASTVLPAIFLPFWITAMLLGVVYLVSCIGLGSAILSKFGTLQPRRHHNYRRSVIYPTPVHNHYGSSLPHPPAHTQPLGPAPTLPREE